MAMHILSRFSIKTNEYIYRVELKHTYIPCLTIIINIYSIWAPLFLMTDSNLPRNLAPKLHQTSKQLQCQQLRIIAHKEITHNFLLTYYKNN